MSRASAARRIAAAAAFGGGGLGALGAGAYGLITLEIRLARRWIGQPFGDDGPAADGVYGAGVGAPIELAMLGDSSSVGLGVDEAREAPGAVLSGGLAAITGRPVRLRTFGVVGAESSALPGQVSNLLDQVAAPDVVVIMVGANDVTHRIRPADAVRALEAAVRRLREAGAEVVVGTCPDLGTIEPLRYPLSAIARRSSRQLAAAQTIATVEAGGRSVSLGDLLGAEFYASPREMFSSDRFHPSAAGYARAAAALLPSVAAALGVWPDQVRTSDARPVAPGGRVDDVAHAAVAAAEVAGTEVSGTDVNGAERGPRGRWALRLRRRAPGVPAGAVDVRPADEPGERPADQAPEQRSSGENSATTPGTVAATTPAQDRNTAPSR